MNSRPSLWSKHWLRLKANADKIGLDISSYDEAMVAALLTEAVERDDVVDGRARITFYDESESPVWPKNNEKKTGLSIITGETRILPDEFRLTVSPYLVNSTSPLAGVKSCNYLENIFALDEAGSRGYHEAVRLNERGKIASGCMANLFWLIGGKLYTPSLGSGCLAGTTREFILENLECEEVTAGLKILNTANEIFLTSAGIGIVQVADISGRKLGQRPNPIMDLYR